MTTNTIKAPGAGNPDSENVRLLKKTMLHLLSPNNKESEDILWEIFQQKQQSSFKQLLSDVEIARLFEVDKKTFHLIINYLLYRDETCQEWMKVKDLDFFIRFLPREEGEGEEEEEGLKINECGKIIAIQNTFARVWRLARDYKKAKEFLGEIKKDSRGLKFKLLAVGGEAEHAEIRIISYLLETSILPKMWAERKARDAVFQIRDRAEKGVEEGEREDTLADSKIFLGISKLCCAGCALFIRAANQALEEMSESLALQYADQNGKEVVETGENKKQLEQAIRTAGSHGISSSWCKPRYFESNNNFYLAVEGRFFPKYWQISAESMTEEKKDDWRKENLDLLYREYTGELSEFYKMFLAKFNSVVENASTVSVSEETKKKLMVSTPSASPTHLSSQVEGENAVNLDESRAVLAAVAVRLNIGIGAISQVRASQVSNATPSAESEYIDILHRDFSM